MDALTAVPATTPVTITGVPVAGVSATNDSPTTLGQAAILCVELCQLAASHMKAWKA
jgi:hypothetical protein